MDRSRKIFYPASISSVCLEDGCQQLAALPFIMKGAHPLFRDRLNVDVLDASALTVSLLSRDFGTAAMLSILLAVGDTLEAWTKQHSLSSLGESLAPDVDKDNSRDRH